MAGNPTLNKDDGAVTQAISAIVDHVGTMDASYNTGVRIQEEIAANYVADSSTMFQRQVEDWLTKCKAVRNMFDTLQQDLQGANTAIDQSDEEALGIGQGWGGGTSDTTFGVLTGH